MAELDNEVAQEAQGEAAEIQDRIRAMIWQISGAKDMPLPARGTARFWRAQELAYLCPDQYAQVFLWNGNELESMMNGESCVLLDDVE